MQLAGPRVFGPPADRDEAIAVLRTAVELGITHIDTSDYYGPYVTNEIIREALYPYPPALTIVTKVGSFRDEKGGWPHARSRDDLRRAVHENLEHLGLDVLDVVNVRVGGVEGPTPGSIAEPFSAVAEMQQEGLIRHLGISTVSVEQVAEARAIAPIVEVRNFYNIANRRDEGLVDSLAEDGIAYVPYFPLGGFSPLQSDTLDDVAASLDARPMSVALAWFTPALAEHPADPGYVVGRAFARERCGSGPGIASRSDRAPELDRRLTRQSLPTRSRGRQRQRPRAEEQQSRLR
jgi:aryl-alcohol dehydrogenase-like predicted oxidoreductase